MSKKEDFVKVVLDTFAIQDNPDYLKIALNHIYTDDVIVFENALTKLKIGNRIVKDKMFDIVIFSEKSDIMILVDRYSSISKDEVFEELKNRDIEYHLVSFIKHESQYYDEKTPELWFARDPNIVRVACDDTLKKSKNLKCKFNRNTEAELNFEFLTTSLNVTTFSSKIKFTGSIRFADKLVFITTSNKIEKKHQKIERIRIH